MSAVPDQRLDLELVEALDFDPPCEKKGHGDFHHGPAWALIDNACPGCGDRRQDFVCRELWDICGMGVLLCPSCGYACRRVEGWRVIALVRP